MQDDFGDVYGIYVVLTGEGYSMAELKEAAKIARKEILQAEDVKRIIFWGDRREAIYVEMSRTKMAALDIRQEDIFNALSAKNLPADAGRMRLAPDYVAIHPTGAEELVTMKHPDPGPVQHADADTGLEWQQAS